MPLNFYNQYLAGNTMFASERSIYCYQKCINKIRPQLSDVRWRPAADDFSFGFLNLLRCLFLHCSFSCPFAFDPAVTASAGQCCPSQLVSGFIRNKCPSLCFCVFVLKTGKEIYPHQWVASHLITSLQYTQCWCFFWNVLTTLMVWCWSQLFLFTSAF